jgi:hypothetical protein
VEDWALIYMANGCHMSNTAKALKVTRGRLYAYLKSDDDLKDAFRDAELEEFDNVRAKLVKLCLHIYNRVAVFPKSLYRCTTLGVNS